MPDLGKATYTLVFDTREAEGAITGLEARADKASRSISTSMGTVERSVTQVGETTQSAAGQVTGATGEMEAGFEKAGAAGQQMGGEVAAGASEAAAASKAAAGKTVTAWAGAGKRMETIGKRMKHVGREMTHKITLPTAIVGGLAIKGAMDYNEQIKLLETQAGATGKEAEYMNKQLLVLAESGKVTHGPEDLAKAMYHLESVGIRGRKAIMALTQADHLATIGNASLEDSTNMLTAVWSTGLSKGMSFSKTIGIINASVGTGNLRMPDFVAALQTGLPDAAKFASLSLQDLGAAIATLTARGIPAQKAAQFLKMSILSLKRPTEQQQKALAVLGTSNLTVATSFRKRGLIPTIQLLQNQYKKLVQAVGRERADAVFLKAFGGVKSGQGMLAMIQGSKRLRENWQHIGTQAGKTGGLVKTAMNEPINKLRANMAQLKAAGIRLGNALIPAFVHLAHAIVRAVQWFQQLSPHMKRMIGYGVLIAAALGPIISLIGTLITLGPPLAAAFAFMLGWPGIIALVAVAIVVLAKKFEWFRNVLSGLFEAIKASWKAVLAVFAAGAAVKGVMVLISAVRALAATEAFATGVTIGLRGALLSLGGMGVVFAAAAAGLYMIGKAAHDAKYEIDALNRVGSVPQQELQMYNIRVRANMAKGMSREDAKKLAVKQVNAAAKREKGAGWVPFKSSTQFGQTAQDKLKEPKMPKMPKIPKYKLPKIPDYKIDTAALKKLEGGAGGGGSKGSPLGGILGSGWAAMQDKLSEAKMTKGLADDKRALQAQDTFLRRMLANHKLSAKKRHAALTALAHVDTALRAVIKKMTPKAKKDTTMADELAIAKAKASMSGSSADRTRVKAIQQKLWQHELGIINAEMASLRKRLANKKLSLHQQAKIFTMLAALDRKKAALWKKMHPKHKGAADTDYGDTKAYNQAELAKAQAEARNDTQGQIAALEKERAIIQKWLHAKKRTLKQQIDAWNEISSLNSEITDLQQQNADEEQQQLDDAKQTLEDQRASIAAIQDLRGSFFSQFAGNVFGVTGAGLTLGAGPQAGGASGQSITQNNHYNEIPKDRYAESRRLKAAVQGAMS